jgi:hypothetical protein
MEFIAGETVQQRLDRVGPLDPAEVVRIGRQIAAGLAAAHATGLIHRDIKPSNILLESGADRVKITDFGLARAADDASLTQSGVIAGTPMYMAPEQAKGETIDHRADLFSLGSVVYACLSGRPPFRASTTLAVLKRVAEDTPRPIREIIPEAPEWLCAIIARLHAKNPADRYQTAAEVAEVLEGCERQMAAGVVPLFPGTAPPRRRRRMAPVALATVGLAVLVAVGVYLALGRGDRGEPLDDSGAASAGAPKLPLTPEELAKLPSPLDGRKRSDIPPELLALAGGGDPDKASAELVGVLGHWPFRLPRWATSYFPALSSDTKWLAVPSGHDVVVFDAATGALRRILTGATDWVFGVAFSPDGKRLAAGCRDGNAYVWEAESGKLERALEGHPSWVWSVIFSPDGKRIATACEDGSLFLWDADGQNKMLLAKQPVTLYVVTFSADGKTLASAGAEGVIVLWDTAAGTEKQSLTGHTAHVITLRYSPDGKTLASGSDQETILWDLETGKPRHTLAAAANGLVAFTADGKNLLTATRRWEGGDGYLMTRWDAATGEKTADVPLGPHRKGVQGFPVLRRERRWHDHLCLPSRPRRPGQRLRRRDRQGEVPAPRLPPRAGVGRRGQPGRQDAGHRRGGSHDSAMGPGRLEGRPAASPRPGPGGAHRTGLVTRVQSGR